MGMQILDKTQIVKEKEAVDKKIASLENARKILVKKRDDAERTLDLFELQIEYIDKLIEHYGGWLEDLVDRKYE